MPTEQEKSHHNLSEKLNSSITAFRAMHEIGATFLGLPAEVSQKIQELLCNPEITEEIQNSAK